MLIPEISDSVCQINVTIIRHIHNHYHHLPNTWTGTKFIRPDAFVFVPSVKNFQDGQQNFRRLPGGIKNSRRYPVLPGVVDTLHIQHTTIPYLTFGVSSLSNRPLSIEAVLRLDATCIPDVTQVTETSLRFDDNTLQDSSDHKVQVPVM